MTSILGISAFYHDSAACLVVDGEIIAAAQEERFTRVKHDKKFPTHAVRYCLNEARLTPEQLDYVAFYEKPLLKFGRLLETYTYCSPAGFPSFLRAMPLWIREKLWMPDLLHLEMAIAAGAEGPKDAKRRAKTFSWKLLFGDHHESHAASAFYPSPFDEAAILTVDGVGEWATSSIGVGRANEIKLLKELRFPHSLGLLYTAFTYHAGFKVNSGEYKIMGLAPYGEPEFVGLIKEKLVEIRDDGSLRMNQEYFNYAQGMTMTSKKFDRLFGGPPRRPDSPLTRKEMNLARSIQVIADETLMKMAAYAQRETGLKRLCMAGGVALNCVANGKILREGPFEDVWIQPAAGDSGGALGVALAVWHRYLGQPRGSREMTVNGSGKTNDCHPPVYQDAMKGALLGPSYTPQEIEQFLTSRKIPFRKYMRDELPGVVAEFLVMGKVIGLHQGRMEFGPRALGSRSIIADARSAKMQSVMNLKIKHRESFRPFAPSVMREHLEDWFEMDVDSPYMLLVSDVSTKRRRETAEGEKAIEGLEKLNTVRSEIPAVTHVDYSARVHTVRREETPLYWEILNAFYQRTGCPVIVNTSFNVRGEPIVCSPEDSYRCFMRTEMDVLVLEDYVLEKNIGAKFEENANWQKDFESAR